MNDTDYQGFVIAAYQQKGYFELFNQNIVYETQITTLKNQLRPAKELENINL